jgi:hypothetical protein
MAPTLCVVKKSPSIAAMDEDSVVTTCKVEAQVIRRTNWNTWIVMCSLIVTLAGVLFIEHHIRGLIVHSGVLN